MSVDEPVDRRRAELQDHAARGDQKWLQNALQSGDLNWLRSRMGIDAFGAVSTAISAGDMEEVRRHLRAAGLLGAVSVVETTERLPGPMVAVQRQRNALVAGAIVAVLLVAGLIGYLLLRDDNKSSDSNVLAVDTSVAQTSTSMPLADVTPTTLDPQGVTSVAPATIAPKATQPAPVSTVVAAPPAAATTQPPAAPVTNPAGALTDVVTTATRSATFSPYLSMVEAAGLTNELKTLNQSTVLAPTESAFSALPADVQSALRSPANRDTLIRIVRYSVIPQKVMLNQFSTSQLKSLEGSALNVVVGNGTVMINDATVTGPDVSTSNSVVLHAIDKLLIPPGVSLKALVSKPTTTPAPSPTPSTSSATAPTAAPSTAPTTTPASAPTTAPVSPTTSSRPTTT